MKKYFSLALALFMISTAAVADTIYYASSNKTSTVTVKNVDTKYITVIGSDQKEYRLFAKDVSKIVYDNGEVFYPGGSKSEKKAKKQAYDELRSSTKDDDDVYAKAEKSEGRSVQLEAVQLVQDAKSIKASRKKGVKLNTSNRDLVEGCYYELLTVVSAEDKSLIDCPIVCQVIQRRRSNISGAEGRLVIRPLYILDKTGKPLYLKTSDIFRRGKNIECSKFWLSFIFPPMIFFAGTRAEIDRYDIIDLRLE